MPARAKGSALPPLQPLLLLHVTAAVGQRLVCRGGSRSFLSGGEGGWRARKMEAMRDQATVRDARWWKEAGGVRKEYRIKLHSFHLHLAEHVHTYGPLTHMAHSITHTHTHAHTRTRAQTRTEHKTNACMLITRMHGRMNIVPTTYLFGSPFLCPCEYVSVSCWERRLPAGVCQRNRRYYYYYYYTP